MKRTNGRKRLSMWGALPPYLGGKRRLCPLIFRELDRVVPRKTWPDLTFLDGFLGAGSVSLYAKAQGLSVVATDIAERAVVVGRALIENSSVQLTYEDILQVAADNGNQPGQVEQKYVPAVFTRAQARLLDRILKAAGRCQRLRESLAVAPACDPCGLVGSLHVISSFRDNSPPNNRRVRIDNAKLCR